MRVYYFSGTGNSLAVARKLCTALPGAALTPIMQVLREPVHRRRLSGEVGIVFPIHMNGLPKPVRRFVEAADFSAVDYLFAVATHGGIPGNVGALLNRVLSGRGRLIDEFFALEMINNTPKGVAPRMLMRMNWAATITPDSVQAMQARSDKALESIIASIAARSTAFGLRYRSERRARGTLTDRLFWRLAEGSNPKLEFLLDAAACTRCGICARVCPSGRVTAPTETAPPLWPAKAECYYCYAYFNFCPQQAVGVRHYTQKDGRYHYPGITAEEIAEQSAGRS